MQARIHVIAAAIIIILRALFLPHPSPSPKPQFDDILPNFLTRSCMQNSVLPFPPIKHPLPLCRVVFAFAFRDPEETSSDCFGTCPTHTGTRMIY